MSKITNICFLRNKKIHKSREEAIKALQGLSNIEDGNIVLGRYKESPNDSRIKTIIGITCSIDDYKFITLFDGSETIQVNNKPNKKYHYEELYKTHESY